MKSWAMAAVLSAALTSSVAAKDLKIAVTGADVVQVAPQFYQFAGLSKMTNSVVSLGVVDDNALQSGVTVLNLTVRNTGQGLIGLSADEVKVTAEDGKPIAVLTYAQMADLAHKSLGGKRFGTGLGNFAMALAAAGAGTHTTYGNYSSNTYVSGTGAATGYGAVANTSGTVSATTYNPYEAAAAQANARAFIDANNAKLRATEEGLNDTARSMSFAPTTVFPGTTKATSIPLEKLPSKAKLLTVSVTLGDEVHHFQVSVAPAPVASGWAVATPSPPPKLTDAGVNAWISDHIDQSGWTFIGYDGAGAYFADLKSFEKLPSGVMRMSFKTELFAPSYQMGLGVLSQRSRWELDCSKRQVRVLVTEEHPDNNLKSLLIKDETPDAAWFAPPQGTVTDRFASQMCMNQPAG